MNEILQENKAWIDETWDKIDAKMQKVCIRSRDKLPGIARNNIHDDQVYIPKTGPTASGAV